MKDADVKLRWDTAHRSSEEMPTSLLVYAKAGDAVGWCRLVALYGPLIYRWSRQSGLDEHAAADVVQKVFSTVHRKIADFRRDRPGDSFRGWVRRITTNKAHDYWRSSIKQPLAVGGSSVHRRLQQLPDGKAADLTEVAPEAHDDDVCSLYRRALELVMNEFEETSWRAFWMTAIDGRKAVDVARDLGITRNAVYIAKSRLRAEFAELID